MDDQHIRPVSICLFRNGDRILVEKDYDTVKESYYCRPLGGGIEFGEHSRDAMLRELDEELGQSVENLRLITVMENLFTLDGHKGHEIVFLYEADFKDKSLYALKELDVYAEESNTVYKAVWLSRDEMHEKEIQLVPEGLEEFLQNEEL
jgi:ADP-ribose pyrophosphatase YjhB (NUDIX family)